MNMHDVSVQRIVRDDPANSLDKTFADLVTDDVKGVISEADAARLRRPENLDAFYGDLVDMLRSFEIQLARQKVRSLQGRQAALANGTIAAWEKDHTKVMEWRRTMNNLRRHVEARLREVRTLRRAQVRTEQVPEVLEAADLLVQAVLYHRDTARTANDEEMEKADHRLWETLDDPAIARLVLRLRQMPKHR